MSFLAPNNYGNFINLILDSSLVRQQIEGPIRTTSGVKNINTTEIKNLIFPLPPLAEQNRIVNKVEKVMSLCEMLQQTIEKTKEESENLMKAVLQEAFAVKEEVLN
jgi:type I restriction enzyme S subunit